MLRIALFTVPVVVVIGLVLFLNDVSAAAGIAMATLGLFFVVTGTGIGYFADRMS